MGENPNKEMSKGRVAQIVALAIVLCAAPVLSNCIATATGTAATNIGGFIVGSTSAGSYAFKGQTAPNNGLWCDGCAKYEAGVTAGTAGIWWTVATVASGATSASAGILCPTAGTACTSVAANTAATAAGKFYSSTTAAAGATATTTGVLCPNTAQSNSPSNTCVAAASGASATHLGTACVGSTAACTAVINGYTATANGVNCGGCVYKNSGETANVDGLWWTAADVVSGATAASAGILCPSDGTACAAVVSGAAASAAGKFYSSISVAAGTAATSAGVLCPSAAAATNYATTTSPYTTAIVTTGQGTAVGTSNSAYKTTVLPLVAVITGFAMMMLK